MKKSHTMNYVVAIDSKMYNCFRQPSEIKFMLYLCVYINFSYRTFLKLNYLPYIANLIMKFNIVIIIILVFFFSRIQQVIQSRMIWIYVWRDQLNTLLLQPLLRIMMRPFIIINKKKLIIYTKKVE